MDEHKNRKPFTPVPNDPYVVVGNLGSVFACLASYADNSALMINLKSGWTCMCHGVGMYDDGYIDWDYSTGGHFREVPYKVVEVTA